MLAWARSHSSPSVPLLISGFSATWGHWQVTGVPEAEESRLGSPSKAPAPRLPLCCWAHLNDL